MKILMALMGLEIGGAETHVVELSKELHKQGHTIIVASNGGVYEQALNQAGIRHVQIPMHQRSAGMMLESLKRMKALIQEEKPDLVHAHARIPAFLCGILHKQMHFPFITSAHWVFEVTPLLRLMTNWGERSVAVSEDIKTYLIQNYQIPADRIHVTINGIDTEQFAPGEKDPELMKAFGIGNGPVIGTVSRLDESRELAAKELIALMPRLLEEVPDAQLIVVGGGNLEDDLQAQAVEVNRQVGRNAVIMTGPRTDIARLVSLCDVFVGVSRAALEAMSAEKPTILAGNEGYIGLFTPEALPSAQETNFCCRGCEQINSERLLADLLILLRMEPSRQHEIGRFGRQVVVEQYSVSKMTADYLEAYRQLLHPVKPVRAAISGYYGYNNLGDDAVLLAISRQLAELSHPVRLSVLSRHPDETAKQYGLEAVHRFSPVDVYKTLKKSDILISGGGSLLQDKTSTRSLWYYLTIIRLAKLLKKPVFLYANGIGPISKAYNRRQVHRCVDFCDVITLRDQESLEELRRLGVTRQDIFVTGDPAFTLAATGTAPLAEFGVPDNSNVVGVSVRSIPETICFAAEFAKLCDRLVREEDKTIVFLVMQESEDEAISRQIQGLMEEKSYLAKAPGEPTQMLAMIRQTEMLISMRLHTIIFAANVHVPVVGCIYDPKVAAFLRMLNMPSCGTPASMKADEAYDIVSRMLRNLPEHQQQLADAMKELTPMAERTVPLFEKTLKEYHLLEGD